MQSSLNMFVNPDSVFFYSSVKQRTMIILRIASARTKIKAHPRGVFGRFPIRQLGTIPVCHALLVLLNIGLHRPPVSPARRRV